MKKNISFFPLIVLLLGGLLLINRNLFHYENIFVFRRNFDPAVDLKGDYNLSTEQFALKSGNYHITVEGTFQQNNSGIYLIDSAEDKILTADLPGNTNKIEVDFSLDKTKQLRFGISYDPNSGNLNVDNFRINANHVLYLESVLKHSTLSASYLILFLLLYLRLFHHDQYQKRLPYLCKPQNEKMIIVLIILTMMTTFPYFNNNNYIIGDDLYFHLTQIRGIAASLKAGYFPVRIILDVLNNYGYGSGFYYPNLFLTIPGILVLLGFGTMESYEIFVTICTFFALITMFLTIRKISSSETAAYAGTILFAFAAYRLVDVFYRAALGEIQAFIFLPLIVSGLYDIFHNHTERWWIFAFAFSGLLNCHMISVTIAGIYTGIWALLHIRTICSDKTIFFSLLKSVILTLLLSAYFLFPMLEQNANNDLKIKAIMLDPLNNSFGQYTPWKSLFRFFYDWNYNELVEHTYPSWWNYGISVRYVYPGWALLLIPILRILLLQKTKKPVQKLADSLTIYAFIAMIMCTDLFPWKYFLHLLFRIQFAWRIMMISTVLLCISCGIYTYEISKKYFPKKNKVIWLLPVFMLSICSSLPIFLETQTHRTMDINEYCYLKQSSFLHGAEYLPIGFDRNAAEKNGDLVLCDTPGFILQSKKREGLSFTFEFILPENTENVLMHIPLIYYTGYHAYLTNKTEETSELQVKGDKGLVTVSNGDTSEGTISVRFEKSPIQFVSDLVSLTTALYCLFLILRSGFCNHKSIIKP